MHRPIPQIAFAQALTALRAGASIDKMDVAPTTKRAAKAVFAIESGDAPDDDIGKLRDEIDRLKTENRKLRKQVDKLEAARDDDAPDDDEGDPARDDAAAVARVNAEAEAFRAAQRGEIPRLSIDWTGGGRR